MLVEPDIPPVPIPAALVAAPVPRVDLAALKAIRDRLRLRPRGLMRSIAVFSVKGGVGKSALAVNLAHASASISGRRTLLWDLDAQGAATYTLRLSPRAEISARKGIAGGELTPLIQASDFANLDVLAADKSLRHLEKQLVEDDKAKRLQEAHQGPGEGL